MKAAVESNVGDSINTLKTNLMMLEKLGSTSLRSTWITSKIIVLD